MESSPRKVAVVEDDPSMRRSIERLLGAHGFETEAYASAESFLENYTPGSVGCLVLDIHLGGMSGIQLRRKMREAGVSLPVIFITAVDDDALQDEAIGTGCLAYLHKPFAAKHLLSALHQVMPGPPEAGEDRT